MKKIILILAMLVSFGLAGEVIASGTININTASVEHLQEVKGIGPKTAEAIVAYRTEHGNFENTMALTLVKGIGEKKLKKIEGELTVEKHKN